MSKHFAVPRASLLGLQTSLGSCNPSLSLALWGDHKPSLACHGFEDCQPQGWWRTMSSLQSYTICSEPSPAAVQGGKAVDSSPSEEKKGTHGHFSVLTPEKNGGTSLWSFCTALYSCALVYGAFSITPDLPAIKREDVGRWKLKVWS